MRGPTRFGRETRQHMGRAHSELGHLCLALQAHDNNELDLVQMRQLAAKVQRSGVRDALPDKYRAIADDLLSTLTEDFDVD